MRRVSPGWMSVTLWADGEDGADAVAAEDVGEGGFGGVLVEGEVAVGGVEGGEVEGEDDVVGVGGGVGEIGEGHGFKAGEGGEEPGCAWGSPCRETSIPAGWKSGTLRGQAISEWGRNGARGSGGDREG